MATMSPASASSIGWRFRPRKASTLVIRPRSISLPSRRQGVDRPCRASALPASTRPVSRRPRKGSLSISTARIWNGSSARRYGLRLAAHGRRSGRTAGPGSSLRLGHVQRRPALLAARRRCAGSRAARRWRPWRRTGRRRRSAPGRDRRAAGRPCSGTTIGRRPIFSALPSTNLVCGMTPSSASTSSTQPSTMPRIRSTSPPKSAWPGVSMMLIRVSPASPCHSTEVHLARMVMPRSRSWSLESMARSTVRLVGAEHAGLGEQLVHQRGLAVVDVGDDGDVAQRHGGRRSLVRKGRGGAGLYARHRVKDQPACYGLVWLIVRRNIL